MQSKLQVGRLCTAATGRAAAGSCSGWLPSWAGPPPPGRLRAPVPIRKPGDGIGWMDGRNILGRARAAGRGRGRSTSSYSRSVGGRLRRRLGSAVSSRSSLERENGSPVVRADRDVAFWTGARELGLVLRVCGDPWRCHGVAGCRAERPVDPWARPVGFGSAAWLGWAPARTGFVVYGARFAASRAPGATCGAVVLFAGVYSDR